jgi:hypothetical protein
METGDVDLSGGVDIDDVVYLVNFIFAGGPPPCDSGSILGMLIGHGGCKEFDRAGETPPDSECVEWEYDGQGTLLLRHINSGFNCCPIISADINIVANTITIVENEDFEFYPCPCLCLFDLEYGIYNLWPSVYTVKFIGLYVYDEDYLEFTLNLITEPTGSRCIYRDDYPWGYEF